jgi:hypothetical protein
MTPSGIEPATFRFVAQYLNHCATISGHHINNQTTEIVHEVNDFGFLFWIATVMGGLVGINIRDRLIIR